MGRPRPDPRARQGTARADRRQAPGRLSRGRVRHLLGRPETPRHVALGDRGRQAVKDVDDGTLPSELTLAQNFPNPFNPSTTIKYSIPITSTVVIKIFDILGNEIETLVNEEKPAGTYELTWNAASLPSGVYFYRIKTGSFVETSKMILMK